MVFHQLTQEEIIKMVDLLVGRVSKALKAKDMDLELTDNAKKLLAKRGFDPVWVLVRCVAPFSAKSRMFYPRRSSSARSVLVRSSPWTWTTGMVNPRARKLNSPLFFA